LHAALPEVPEAAVGVGVGVGVGSKAASAEASGDVAGNGVAGNGVAGNGSGDDEPNEQDEYSEQSAQRSSDAKYLTFSDLVAALRGDGTGYVRMLIGEVSLAEISKMSYGCVSVRHTVRVGA
jgi:hypothetical protein